MFVQEDFIINVSKQIVSSYSLCIGREWTAQKLFEKNDASREIARRKKKRGRRARLGEVLLIVIMRVDLSMVLSTCADLCMCGSRPAFFQNFFPQNRKTTTFDCFFSCDRSGSWKDAGLRQTCQPSL